MKRKCIPLWKALKEDGICACYDVENCGRCKDNVTRWYHFTTVNGEPAYTLKR